MKKIVSVLLAALLLLSLMATAVMTVGAEEKTKVLYEIPNVLASNQNDGKSEGWRNSKVDAGKAPLQEMQLNDQIGFGATFSGAEPNFFNTIRFLYYTATPYDLSDIKYIEFDLYISNASMYSSASNSIMVEICSSGRQDANEISTDIRPELVDGWNHIKIEFAKLKSGSPEPFDITAWNFFRLCVNGPYDTGSDELTMAIANLTFWNGLNEDGLDEDEIKQQEMMAKIQKVMDKINELVNIKSKDDLNSDNHEAIKKIIAEAYELYNVLEQESKDLVSDEGGLRILKTAERAVKAYEEEQAEKQECTAHVDENADGKCDVCEADVPKADPECTTHVDEANDGKCDVCGADVPKHDPDGDETPETPDTPEEPAKKGCMGALSIGAVASMILAGAWATIAARKKQD